MTHVNKAGVYKSRGYSFFMTNEERDIQRKLSVLQHAGKIGNARKACRYFGSEDPALCKDMAIEPRVPGPSNYLR